MTFDKETITKNVNNWALENIGSNFKFREHQLETIVDILYGILNNSLHTQIIEAPTGSGKSLLNIISAGVLYDYYGRESYILCSDLYLWKQYEDFVNKHIAIRTKFGILKGQTGNYTCAVNQQDIRNADCRMAGVSWGNMFNASSADELGYKCATSCQYVKARKKALRSGVVIMTYALYHYMVNVVNKTMPGAQNCFKPKDTIFCDECHNIPGIMALEFAPIIRKSDIEIFKTLYDYGRNCELDLFEDNSNIVELICKKEKWEDIQSEFDEIYSIATNEYATKIEDFANIENYLSLIRRFIPTVEQIESDLSYKKQELKMTFTKEDVKFYRACSSIRNINCFWSDFNECIAETGIDCVVKLVNENKITKSLDAVFNIAKEDFICYKFLHSTAKNRVLMSATVGGYEAYTANCGIHYIEKNEGEDSVSYAVIPSTFDFSTSPVNFLNRYKMSYREKEESFPHIKELIYSICKKFNGQKGMIQTGSYQNAKEIYDGAPPEVRKRLLLYNNSKEKTSTITLHQMSKDTILIGPTLVEGIDLPGDQCRFIVIAKVPYPVITDKYVKKKMELFPAWYNSTTSNIIIQGIGRGNRFKEDSCTTYILDACFLSLYNATKDQYPTELQNRIKIAR